MELREKGIQEARERFMAAYRTGDYKSALYIGKHLLNLCSKNVQQMPLDYAQCLHNIALVFDELKLYDKAAEYYKKAAVVKEKISGAALSYADSLNNLAIAESNQQQHEQALDYLKTVLKIRRLRLGETHRDTIHTLYNMGNVNFEMGEYAQAGQCLEKALHIGLESGADMEDVIDICNALARTCDEIGNYKKTILYYEAAQDFYEKQLGAMHSGYVTNSLLLAEICERAGFMELAVEYNEKALKIRQKLMPELHMDYIHHLNHLALLYCRAERYEQAITTHNRAIALAEQLLGKEHIFCAELMEHLAMDYCGKKAYDTATDYVHKAMQIKKKYLPENALQMAASHMLLGAIAEDMEDFPTAMTQYTMALQIAWENSEQDIEGIAEIFCAIAHALSAQGAYEGAVTCYLYALRKSKDCLRVPFRIHIMLWMAEAVQKQGDAIDAIIFCENAVLLARKHYGEKHAAYAIVQAELGHAYQEVGDLMMAQNVLEQAHSLQKEVLDEDSPEYLKTLESLAEVCFLRGDFAQAIRLFQDRNDLNFEEIGEDLREAASTLLAIACCYYQQDEHEKARAYAIEAMAKLKRSRLQPDEKYLRWKERYYAAVDGREPNKLAQPPADVEKQKKRIQAILFLEEQCQLIDGKVETELDSQLELIFSFALANLYKLLFSHQDALYWYMRSQLAELDVDCLRAARLAGQFYFSIGESERAFGVFSDCKQYLEDNAAYESAEYCVIQGLLGDYYYKIGDWENAQKLYLSWSALYHTKKFPDTPDYSARLERLCRALLQSGRSQEAAEQYSRLAISVRNREGESSGYAMLLLELAALFVKMKKTSEAETLLDRAMLLLERAKRTKEDAASFYAQVAALYAAVGQRKKALSLLQLTYTTGGEVAMTAESMQLLLELTQEMDGENSLFSVKNNEEIE